MLRRLRQMLGLLALFAYLANGAQAHMQIVSGETIIVPICGDGLHRTIEMEVGGEPQDTSDTTCCGDCAVPMAIGVEPPSQPVQAQVAHVLSFSGVTGAAHPRSPLWPGAPPQGPPILV
ncbi:hypothetical protein WNY37_03110 [Henriciella sp. AS95]|uniref:hypothetical protein n=1 Tax=Henriciella sp. AS95 TaxID=3135782 RepID=UPI00317B014E